LSTTPTNKAMPAICNEGCNKQFEVNGFQTARLPGAIEKTYFTCPHCKHEYVAFYTDLEVRDLQAKIRRVQTKLQNPRVDQAETLKQVKDLQAQIKEGMDRVKAKVEGGTGV
jgi:transcription elongation factor Elf1